MDVQNIIIEVDFQGLILNVRPDKDHKWLLTTEEVAKGYGVSAKNIYSHSERHSDELINNTHYLILQNAESGQTRHIRYWTREGVIMLGFFIKSEQAKIFRKWAAQLILNHIEAKDNIDLATFEQNLLDKVAQMLAENKVTQRETSLAYADAVYTMLHDRLQNLEAKFTLPSIDARIAYVYLMRIVGTKECKIGKSIKPLERLLNFEQVGVSLELLATIEFSSEKLAFSAEKFLHLIFKEKHLKGEWFLLEESDIALFLQLSEIFANWQ